MGVELGAFMAMALTDQRLLLMSVGGVAKVKDLLGEVPLAEIDSISVEKVMLRARKRIRISARGGSFVLEAPGRQAAEQFTEAFDRLRATAVASDQRPAPRSLGVGASGSTDAARRTTTERPEPRAWR